MAQGWTGSSAGWRRSAVTSGSTAPRAARPALRWRYRACCRSRRPLLLRDGLVRLVQAYGHSVVAAVETGPAALDALLTSRPDVAIIGVRLPPTFSDEGLQAALAARREVPGLPVLILSQHVEQLYARELLADGQGGIGYQLKDRVLDAASSWTRSAASPGAARRSTRRSSRSCSAGPGAWARRAPTRSPRSPTASGRCSR